jgi:hypothetical protein
MFTVNSVQWLRLRAGFVFAYHELLVEGLHRMTDEEWKDRLLARDPVPDVERFAPLLAQ